MKRIVVSIVRRPAVGRFHEDDEWRRAESTEAVKKSSRREYRMKSTGAWALGNGDSLAAGVIPGYGRPNGGLPMSIVRFAWLALAACILMTFSGPAAAQTRQPSTFRVLNHNTGADLRPVAIVPGPRGGVVNFYNLGNGAYSVVEMAPRGAARLTAQIRQLNDPVRIYRAINPGVAVPPAVQALAIADRSRPRPDTRFSENEPLEADEIAILRRYGVDTAAIQRRSAVSERAETFLCAICPYSEWWQSHIGYLAKFNYTCRQGISTYFGKAWWSNVASWFWVSPESPPFGFTGAYAGIGRVVGGDTYIYLATFHSDQDIFTWSFNVTGHPYMIKLLSTYSQNLGDFDHSIWNDW
jgi:hypothetical protein